MHIWVLVNDGQCAKWVDAQNVTIMGRMALEICLIRKHLQPKLGLLTAVDG